METLMKILDLMWLFVNSPFGMAIVVTVLTGLGAKVYASRPQWKKYEGAIIEAIKYAEKAIPDDTENKAARKFDCALRYVLKIHNEVENRTAKPADVAMLSEGIRIIHAGLESDGILKKAGMTAAVLLLCCGILFGGCANTHNVLDMDRKGNLYKRTDDASVGTIDIDGW